MNRRRGEPPDVSDPVYEELRIVRDGVQEVLGVLTFMARDPEVIGRQLEELRNFFGGGARRSEVYLALDRNRNISEVANALGMKRQNVGREIARLQERELILSLTAVGRGDVWIKNPTLERVLHLSQNLRQWYPPRPPAGTAPKGPSDDAQPEPAASGAP